MKSILDEAKHITGNDRMKQYGHPRNNFGDVARLWSAYITNKFDINLTLEAKDIALMMCLFKVCRELAGHKRDNLVDAAGYIRNCAQIEIEEENNDWRRDLIANRNNSIYVGENWKNKHTIVKNTKKK